MYVAVMVLANERVHLQRGNGRTNARIGRGEYFASEHRFGSLRFDDDSDVRFPGKILWFFPTDLEKKDQGSDSLLRANSGK